MAKDFRKTWSSVIFSTTTSLSRNPQVKFQSLTRPHRHLCIYSIGDLSRACLHETQQPGPDLLCPWSSSQDKALFGEPHIDLSFRGALNFQTFFHHQVSTSHELSTNIALYPILGVCNPKVRFFD